MHFALDPYFACLLFAGVALGTLSLAVGPRLIVLWVTLLGLWLVYREGQAIRLEYRLVDVGRGAGIGLLVSVPVVVLAFRGLTTAIPILYVGGNDPAAAVVSGTMVFATLAVLAPLAEELFFRDILQKERGFWTAVAFYAIGGVLFFLPTAGRYLVVLVAVSGATAVLGVIYAFLYRRYGLTAALACHVAVNLILLCIPATLSHLELFAR